MPLVIRRPEDIGQLAGCKIISAEAVPGGIALVVETMLEERYRIQLTGFAGAGLSGNILVLTPGLNIAIEEVKR